jgi:hypothetical protein
MNSQLDHPVAPIRVGALLGLSAKRVLVDWSNAAEMSELTFFFRPILSRLLSSRGRVTRDSLIELSCRTRSGTTGNRRRLYAKVDSSTVGRHR